MAVDLRVLAVTLGLSVVAGLAFGLIPALQAGRTDVQGALRSETGHGASAGRDRSTLRSTLVVAEVALAVTLAIWCGPPHQELLAAAADRPGLPGRRCRQGRVPAARQPLSDGLPAFPEPARDPGVHTNAARSRQGAARSGLGRRRREPSARSGLHQLVPDRGTRSRSALAARDLCEAGHRGLFPDDGRAARQRAVARRRRYRGHADGRRHQRGGRAAILSQGRPRRPPDQLLGDGAHDRWRGRQRTIPGVDRGAGHRALFAAGSGALADGRAARARGGRSGGTHRQRARRHPRHRPGARGVRPRAVHRDRVAIGRGAAVHDARPRAPRGGRPDPRRHRHPRCAQLHRGGSVRARSGSGSRSAPSRDVSGRSSSRERWCSPGSEPPSAW